MVGGGAEASLGGGIKEGKQASGLSRAGCWENPATRLLPGWDDLGALNAFRWEEPRATLKGQSLAPTGGRRYLNPCAWITARYLPLAHRLRVKTRAALLPPHRDFRHFLRGRWPEDSGRK